MKYKSYSHHRRDRTMLYLAGAVFFMSLLIVGYLETQEQADKYRHCMFMQWPNDSQEARDYCSKKTGYTPGITVGHGGVK